MSSPLKQEIIFVALTRPQMFAGVTYSFFVMNLIVSAELFLIFKTFWAIAIAAVLHIVGVLLACASRVSSISGLPE